MVNSWSQAGRTTRVIRRGERQGVGRRPRRATSITSNYIDFNTKSQDILFFDLLVRHVTVHGRVLPLLCLFLSLPGAFQAQPLRRCEQTGCQRSSPRGTRRLGLFLAGRWVCKGSRPRCGGGVRGFVRGWTSVADGAGLEVTTRTAHRRQGARVRRLAPRPLLPPPLPPPPPLVLLPTPQRRRVRWLPRVGRQDAVGLHQGPPQLHHPLRKRRCGRLGPRPSAVRGRDTSEGRPPRRAPLTRSRLLPRGLALPLLLLRGHRVAARAPPQGRRGPPRYCQGRPAPPRRLPNRPVAPTRPLLVQRALRGQPPRPVAHRPVLRQQVPPRPRPPLAAERPLGAVPSLHFARAASPQLSRQPRPAPSRGGARAPLAVAP